MPGQEISHPNHERTTESSRSGAIQDADIKWDGMTFWEGPSLRVPVQAVHTALHSVLLHSSRMRIRPRLVVIEEAMLRALFQWIFDDRLLRILRGRPIWLTSLFCALPERLELQDALQLRITRFQERLFRQCRRRACRQWAVGLGKA